VLDDSGYNLTRQSLEEMWNEFAEKSLEEINLQVSFKSVRERPHF
jgi:hypothetical protein